MGTKQRLDVTFISSAPADELAGLVELLNQKPVAYSVSRPGALGLLLGTLYDPPRQTWRPPSLVAILPGEPIDRELVEAITSFSGYPILVLTFREGRKKNPEAAELKRMMQTGGHCNFSVRKGDEATLLKAAAFIIDSVSAA